MEDFCNAVGSFNAVRLEKCKGNMERIKCFKGTEFHERTDNNLQHNFKVCADKYNKAKGTRAALAFIKQIKLGFGSCLKIKRKKKKKLEHLEFREIKKQVVNEHGNEPTGNIIALPSVINYDFRIVKNYKGQWFVCIPSGLKIDKVGRIRPEDIGNPKDKSECKFSLGLNFEKIIALDPGVRTFISGVLNKRNIIIFS